MFLIKHSILMFNYVASKIRISLKTSDEVLNFWKCMIS